MDINVHDQEMARVAEKTEKPWNAADARLSDTVDNLTRLVDHLEGRLVLVMREDDSPGSTPPEFGSRNAPVVMTLHHYADRIFDVNERLSTILDRLDI